MRLSQLSLRNFRNIENAELTIPRDGFALAGENGHGKTNLLEAIHYLQIFRSMRGARDQELIRFDEAAFYISAIYGNEPDKVGHEIKTAFERRRKVKKVVIDGASAHRLSDAFGAVPSVVISPRDTSLITGSPSERRRFMDLLLSLRSKTYLNALQRYKSALVQRNAALRHQMKAKQNDKETIAAWEPVLASFGATLIKARLEWIESHAVNYSQLCADIGESRSSTMAYNSSISYGDDPEKALAHALESHRTMDSRRGITGLGPHRDDIRFLLGGRELRLYGSAGQQRTAAISLKLLELLSLMRDPAKPPILLLDDPFAELDTRRAGHILNLLNGAGVGQTIIAVPREDDIPADLSSLARWSISDGIIQDNVIR